MKRIPELAELPVIFISGYGNDETIARAFELVDTGKDQVEKHEIGDSTSISAPDLGDRPSLARSSPPRRWRRESRFLLQSLGLRVESVRRHRIDTKMTPSDTSHP